MKKLFFIMLMTFVCGCVSDKLDVKTTEPWENHYMSVEEFYTNTSNIKLDRGQSIWVLSNDTLKRVLKQNRDRK